MSLNTIGRSRRVWDRRAPRYDRDMRLVEPLLFGRDTRAHVCAQAGGDVLEVAIGTGLNLPHYPLGIRLTGVDLSPLMLAAARERAADLGLTVDLREAEAEHLPFGDASFDTVVCTLSLCSIPDDHRAVAETRRVLRPGGRFVLLEHVRSPLGAVRLFQHFLEPLFRRDGDTLLREPLEHLRAEGFDIEQLERSKLGVVERVVACRPT